MLRTETPASLHKSSTLGSQGWQLLPLLVFYFSVLYLLLVFLNVTFHFLCLNIDYM